MIHDLPVFLRVQQPQIELLQFPLFQMPHTVIGHDHIHAQPTVPIVLLQDFPHKVRQITDTQTIMQLVKAGHRQSVSGKQQIVLVKITVAQLEGAIRHLRLCLQLQHLLRLRHIVPVAF